MNKKTCSFVIYTGVYLRYIHISIWMNYLQNIIHLQKTAYTPAYINKYITFREGHGAMVRAWRSADVTACRAVSNPAWSRIFRKISCFPPLNRGTLLRWCVLGQDISTSNASLNWLRWKWVPGRTEMEMCTISSMRRNGCKTVWSPGSWNGTRMSRSSDQGVKCKVWW